MCHVMHLDPSGDSLVVRSFKTSAQPILLGFIILHLMEGMISVGSTLLFCFLCGVFPLDFAYKNPPSPPLLGMIEDEEEE